MKTESQVTSSVSGNARHLTGTPEHYTPSEVVEAARTTLGAIDLDPASCEAASRVVRASSYYTKQQNGFTQPWRGRLFMNPPGGWCDACGRPVIKGMWFRGGWFDSLSALWKEVSTGRFTSNEGSNGIDTEGRNGEYPCAGDLKPGVETGDCGLPPGHQHAGVDSSQKKWWQELAFWWSVGHVTAAIFVSFSIELLQTTQVDPQGPLPLDFPICYPARRLAYTREDGTVGKSPPHASAIICVSTDATIIARFRTVSVLLTYSQVLQAGRLSPPPT